MQLIELLLPQRAMIDFGFDILRRQSELYARRTQSGEAVSPERALALSAYFACVRLISEDIGKLPMSLYRRVPKGKAPADDHPVAKLMRVTPNDEMTAMSFRETMTHYALGWGNAVAEIQRNGRGVPIALHPIHPSRVRMRRLDDLSLVYDIGSDVILGGTQFDTVRLRPEDVLHIHGLGSNGLFGYSIARLAAESIGIGLAAQTFGATFFGNGASVGGVLEHPGKLDDAARKNLRDSWQAMHGGPANAGKTAILEEGLKFSRTSIPPDDAQFLETRQFEVEEICRWFRVPPHKAQQLLRATFTNIEQQNQEYVVDCLTSWSTRWEQEGARKLLAPNEIDRLYFKFDFRELLRGDHNARANFYRTQVNIGAMTPNEVRAAEDMNPGGPELDDFFMQSNMIQVDRLGTTTTRAGAPGAAAALPAPKGEPDGDEVDDGAAGDDPKAQLLAAQASALRPVFLDAADRVLRKEVLAVGKAVVRAKADPAAFVRWADEFYSEQVGFMVEALEPPVQALASIAAHVRGAELADVDLRTFARLHAADSHAACTASRGAALRAGNTAAILADEAIALVLGDSPVRTSP